MVEPKACTLEDVDRNSVLLPSVRILAKPPKGPVIEVALGMEPLVVGTSPECDLVLADARVSRRHCELRMTRRGIVLRDLGSRNGTMINGVPVIEGIVPLSATVTIGSSSLTARLEGGSFVRLSSAERFGGAVGKSVAMRALFAKLERVAMTDETILLLGESGTGKEVLARAIHGESSRKDGPFVVVDCSTIAPSLIEAELFGHSRGAFTGAVGAQAGLLEQADGGTLFIDEIGELPLDLQPKLLRALEARQVRRVGASEWRSFDARVVAATHRNLKARAAEGAFRADLYYRLAVVEVHVPALRERKEDIPILVEHFLAMRSPSGALADLPPSAVSMLTSHDWPGNIRELRNIVARLVLFPDLTADALGIQPATAGPAAAPAEGGEARAPAEALGGLSAVHKLPLREAREVVLEQFERNYIATKLWEHQGNVSRAADASGISRQHAHRLIDRYMLRQGGAASDRPGRPRTAPGEKDDD